MAIIEGFARDERDRPILFGVIKVLDERGAEVKVGNTDADGEFHVDVPEGQKYQVCLLTERYEPLCSEVLDEQGDWTPLPEEGRRLRLDTRLQAMFAQIR